MLSFSSQAYQMERFICTSFAYVIIFYPVVEILKNWHMIPHFMRWGII